MIPNNSLQDEMIKAYIESVFNKYDTDRNGSLDVREMTLFFNDLFRSLNINMVVTDAQSLEAIRSIDDNSDGLVDRAELFKAFKAMLGP
jgi:Ca2+-binding EF-hand superfamily protein